MQNISYQKIYTFCLSAVNDEATSTYYQIFEQIEVIQRIVLTRISKLNDSILDKKQGDQTQQKIVWKSNWFINSTRSFSVCLKTWKKNLRKDKQGMHIVAWSCCSQRLFDGIHCCTTFVFDYMSQFNDGKN